MRHSDVYRICNADTQEVLGHVAVGVEGDMGHSFSYYFRDNQGTYFHLINITSMDVTAVVDLEEGKLWDLVDQHLAHTGVPRTYTRLNDLEWCKACKIAPNVTVAAWLSNMEYYFKED